MDVLDGWSTYSGPLYRKLATAIRQAVVNGEIAPGTVLPAERHLAKALAVGRSTVVGAYDLLRAEGVVESRQGSGTWVSGADRSPRSSERPQESLRGAALSGTEQLVDLATASLPATPVVKEALTALQGEPLDALLAETGYAALGLMALRSTVAEMFSSGGLPTTAEQILITTGDQQALSLIAHQSLDRGDTAVVEDPTSPGMLDLLRDYPVATRGCRSLAGSGPGPVLDIVAKSNPALVYLLTCLGPEGRVSTEPQVREIAAGLRDFRGVLVEDTSSRQLVPDTPPSLIAKIAPRLNVLTVGSMSKLFWGGLRVGWVRGDENTILRLSRAKARADLGTPLLSQLVSAWLLQRMDRVRSERVDALQLRHIQARNTLARLLPEFELASSEGGVTLWLGMPGGASRPFAEVARRHGVAIVAGSALSANGSSDGYVRVALGPSAAVFDDGIERLAQAWSNYHDANAAEQNLMDGSALV